MKNPDNLVVSVFMITYKHEAFIEKAIDGILMQETSFDFDIVIGEDCSADNTLAICKDYESKYPGKVKVLETSQNLGMMRNWVRTHEYCKGKYIALCEGDDYWTDPHKLQKQVDFLESHPDFAMTFHKVNIDKTDPSDTYDYLTPPKQVLDFFELHRKQIVPTCSVVFRREAIGDKYPDWFVNLGIADLPLELLVSATGKTHYFEEPMAAYRRNPGSITHSKEQKRKGRKIYTDVYRTVRDNIDNEFRFFLTFKIYKNRLGIIKDFLGMNKSIKG